MDSAKKMDVINVIALPMVPLDEHQVVSVNARKTLENSLKKQLQDHPPTCIIGSMSQVNQKITEIDLGPSLWASISPGDQRKSYRYPAKAQSSGMPRLS